MITIRKYAFTVREIAVDDTDVVVVEAAKQNSQRYTELLLVSNRLRVLVVVVSYGMSNGKNVGSLIGIASLEHVFTSTSTPASK
jgi:hypothetical protein